MVERAKKRTAPILFTVLVAMILAVTGIGLLGADYATAKASVPAAAESDANGDGENAQESATTVYTYSSQGRYTPTLTPGVWFFEVWGAQGGGNNGTAASTNESTTKNGHGGRGAYAYGYYTVSGSSSVQAYVYVGGVGGNCNGFSARGAGGYNGGGASGWGNGYGVTSGGGGGTDIRIGGDSLSYRKIVAGGGGGGGSSGGITTMSYGGYAGGHNTAAQDGYLWCCGNAGTGANGSRPGKGGTIRVNAKNAGQDGSFGQGGYGGNCPANWAGGGGGGGGYYGGGGGSDGCGYAAGGGGSSYIGGVTNRPSGVNTALAPVASAGSVNGGTSQKQPDGTTGYGHKGAGYARLTLVNTVPSQNGTPNFVLNRTSKITVNVNATQGGNYNLNGKDGDPNEVVVLANTGIYRDASTATPENNPANGEYYLEYSLSTNAQSFTVKAKRYWHGTKNFYVNVKDYNTSSGTYPGGNIFFRFTATCDAGTMDAMPNSIAGMKYGISGANIYNPLGDGRRTLYIENPLSVNRATTINVRDLYTLAGGTINGGANVGTEERIVFNTSITYGTKRYHKDAPHTEETISSAVAGSDSSYFTRAEWETPVSVLEYTPPSAPKSTPVGATVLKLYGKPNIPAGPYYYTMQIKVRHLDYYSGALQKQSNGTDDEQTIDVVYRVDNTRPVFQDPGVVELISGGPEVSVNLSAICKDPDGNALTIKDVIVPQNEYVSLDQYGNLQSTGNAHYNIGADPSGKYDPSDEAVTKTAQTGTTTGFSPTLIYKASGANADGSFAPSQNNQGNAGNAVLGYYVNSAASGDPARTVLYLSGNKASRNQYKAGRANALGDFYIMIQITDAGNAEDLGIWYPLAVRVVSAAPEANGHPSVNAAAGSVHYFTPLGYQTADGYFGIGTYLPDSSERFSADVTAANGIAYEDGQPVTAGKIPVLPFAYDRDNYTYTETDKPRTVTLGGGKTVTLAATVGNLPATCAQYEPVFLTPDSEGRVNYALTQALKAVYGNAYSNIEDFKQGFKEFFTVEFIDLYAQTGILRGLTDAKIQELYNQGIIRFNTVNGNEYVVYQGLKITLHKYTMSKYLSFTAEVTDTSGDTTSARPNKTAEIRIAVNVQNTPISNDSARSTTKNNLNTRGTFNKNHDRVERRDDVESKVVFEFRMYVQETLRISPYDLLYSPDSYTAYNPADTVASGTDAHTNFMQGINKSMWVYASDLPDAEPTEVKDFHFKKLTVTESNRDVQASGEGIYGTVDYVNETEDGRVSEYFVVESTNKTQAGGALSFDYIIDGDGHSVTVSVRVIIENSLPEVRPGINTLFNLSAEPTLGNSSAKEVRDGDHYTINAETYNVREFTLNDLFIDRDGDGIRFLRVSDGITVGTKDTLGNFVPFEAGQNVFIKAYIGSGTNVRTGNNSCLIIEGLSCTYGVPGGVWVKFAVIDNAIGTDVNNPAYGLFQVEVHNSAPAYAGVDEGNTMELTTLDDGTPVGYKWQADSENTVLHAAKALETGDKTLHAPNGDTLDSNTPIERPMFVAANKASMDAYRELVKTTGHLDNFRYADTQVQYIARDADKGQRLALYSAGYHPDNDASVAPGFAVLTPGETPQHVFGGSTNAAVVINNFYGVDDTTYYADNNVVQIICFAPNASGKLERVEGAEANNATDWVIAFHYVTTPSKGQDLQVYIRLRDADNALTMPNATETGATVAPATMGGYSFGETQYKGVRTVNSAGDGFVPNHTNEILGGNTESNQTQLGIFSFTLHKKSGGLYDNLTKWRSSATTTLGNTSQTIDVNNVWAIQGEDKIYTYADTLKTIPADYKVFRYEGITVPAGSGSSVAVPISYFAWPDGNKSTIVRGTAQTSYAWYNVPGSFGTNNVYGAITLSDGQNTWSGDALNDNPYITFEPVANNSGTFVSSSNAYLSGQRISLTEKNVNPMPVTDDQHAGYFYEDVSGLVLTKKHIRSAGNGLTLTVNLAEWSGNSSGDKAIVEDTAITVSVPVKVENTALRVENPVEDVITSADEGSKTVALTTNSALDQNKYTEGAVKISGKSDDDQIPATQAGGNAIGGIVYREDMYFLAESATGITADQLAHIKNSFSLMALAVQRRVAEYFGIATYTGDTEPTDENDPAWIGSSALSAEINKLSTTQNPQTGGWDVSYNGTAVKTNENYTNYFTVSPGGLDSQYISIAPLHMTTFRTDGMDHDTIVAEAEKRGLVPVFTNNSGTESVEFYYALKMIVYDRLTVGYASNTTAFTDTDGSYDVVTLRIYIRNSAPKIVSRNFNDPDILTGYGVHGVTISLAKDQSVSYNFSDMFTDADMILNGYNYLTEEQVKAQDSDIVKDTGDYLQKVSGSNRLVKVEYLNSDKGSKNEDSVTCAVTDTQATVTVKNRVQGFTSGDVAARIKLTFTDSYGVSDSLIIAVKIANKAPTLTSNAQQVRTVRMKTGQYFTLYTTPFKDDKDPSKGFMAGAGNSLTVGSMQNGSYNGTYFAAMNGSALNISKNLEGGLQRWSYAEGLYDAAQQKYVPYSEKSPVPDIKVGTDAYEDTNFTSKNSTKQSLGYMAIAEDDAPWTLRISTESGVDVGSEMIRYTPLNYVLFEGSESGTDNEVAGATAVVFEAIGACTDVTVRVRLTDGHSAIAGDTPLSVEYTFKITVDSTPPKAITAESEKHDTEHYLGKSLPKDMQSRLTHVKEEQTSKNYVYRLNMFVGEEFTMQTKDFAHDIDSRDDEIIYLLPRQGEDPFQIVTADNSTGFVGNGTQCISLSQSQGSTRTPRNKVFSVKALNFHNETNQQEISYYDEVQFYICDPYSSSVDDSVLIKLRVYVYPRLPVSVLDPDTAKPQSNATVLDIRSVTDAEKEGAQEVKLVTKPGEGGLIEDADAFSTRTQYSVNVYTLAHYNDKDAVVGYSYSEFRALGSAQKEAQKVASWTIKGISSNGVLELPNDEAHKSAQIVREFISSISFSADGTVMYVTPNKATNTQKYISGSERVGFQLYVEVKKFVSRTGFDVGYGPGISSSSAPTYAAGALLNTRILNSAPKAVGNTDNNRGIHAENRPYLSVEGRRGDSWEYYVHNYKTTRDEALFTDPDGDVLTFAGREILDVYTLDDAGINETSYKNNAMVMQSAEDNIRFQTLTKAFEVPNSDETVEYNAVRITVLRKITLPGNNSRPVYVKIRVYGQDPSGAEDKTEIIVCVRNSEPVFKSTEEMDARYKTGFNAYERDDNTGNASLTLTLNRDNSDKFITQDGKVTIPLSALISDADYDSNAQQNTEYFHFESAGSVASGRADMSVISGNSGLTLWLDNEEHGTTTDSATVADKRFLVRVLNDNNSAIVFTVNSYDRGATEQLVLRVADTSNAMTGILTVTLVVGNSAPIDLTLSGEASNSIVLAGGKTPPNGDAFESVRYSLLDYVTDNNPADKQKYSETPVDVTTYLRITGYTPGAIMFDPASEFDDYIGSVGGSGTGATENEEPQALVSFTPFEQSFVITPLPKLYGRQKITLTVTDDGNSSSNDSEYIRLEIEIQITKNPDDMETQEVSIYWKQTRPITPRDLFGDESEGLLIKKISLKNESSDPAAVFNNVTGSDVWTAQGNRRNEQETAVAEVIVGTSLTEGAKVYYKDFVIKVLDNLKPEFRMVGDKSYGEGVNYIDKGEFNDDGIWEVPVTRFFYDKEGDEIKLVKASSQKSTLIDVTADTQNNRLIFHFKSRGDSKISVSISDAVATYDYELYIGNTDLPEPNFFISLISKIQGNPLLFIIIAAAVLVLLIILIAIIAAVRKKKKMRAEIEALLVSEMELEEQMLKLAAGPSPTFYQTYGYLPPTPGAQQQPGLMLGSGQGAPDPNAALGLNPGNAGTNPAQSAPNNALPPLDDGFNDDDL